MIQKNVLIQGISLFKDEDDLLLLHATKHDFLCRKARIEELETTIVGDLFAATNSPLWNTADERCYRFLARSLDNFAAQLGTYMDLAGRIYSLNSSDRLLLECCEDVDRRVNELVRVRLPSCSSEQWTCNPPATCASLDHMHTLDRLVWPFQNTNEEKKLPRGSSPLVHWRDSRTRQFPQTSALQACLTPRSEH